MKRFILLLLLLLPLTAGGTEQCRIFLLNIDSEIHAKSARTLEKALREAGDWDAGVFLMQLNTFGGALDAAEKMHGSA